MYRDRQTNDNPLSFSHCLSLLMKLPLSLLQCLLIKRLPLTALQENVLFERCEKKLYFVC